MLWAAARRKDPLVYLLASERNLCWFTRHARRLGSRLVATYHAPPALLEERMESRYLRTCLAAVNRVIIVSGSQRGFFADYLPDDRILHAPHRVDTDAFSPAPDAGPVADGRLLYLTTGHWLRDVRVLKGVYARLRAERGGGARLVAVCAREHVDPHRSAGHGLESHTAVPEHEFVAPYRAASVVLLPLTDATAMACGCVIVATDVGGTAEYLGPVGELAPLGDVMAHGTAVQALLDTARGDGSSGRRTGSGLAGLPGPASPPGSPVCAGEQLSGPDDAQN
ncbi:MAG: glycosyltransferase [Streptosporangiaceae bacterium]